MCGARVALNGDNNVLEWHASARETNTVAPSRADFRSRRSMSAPKLPDTTCEAVGRTTGGKGSDGGVGKGLAPTPGLG